MGSVDTTIVGPEDDRTVAILTRGSVRNSVFRNVGSPQDVCSVMNLAAHEGISIPAERIGKRTPREFMRTAGAYVGQFIVEAMTAERD